MLSAQLCLSVPVSVFAVVASDEVASESVEVELSSPQAIKLTKSRAAKRGLRARIQVLQRG